MKLEILYFAAVGELVGRRSEKLELPHSELAVRALCSVLVSRSPRLAGGLESVRFAVNEEFVESSHVVRDGDVVALIPPVSGG